MSAEVKDALDEALGRLGSHFGTKAVSAGKPATAKAIAALDAKLNGLAEQHAALLALADGIEVDGCDGQVGLMSVDEIGKTVGGTRREGINPFTKEKIVFEPRKPHPHWVMLQSLDVGMMTVLRGVGTGDGAVVFYDLEEGPEDGYVLLASGVASFLRLWSRWAVACYDASGEAKSFDGDGRFPFAAETVKKHDPGAATLLKDRQFAKFLKDAAPQALQA